jgi:hypothetical protein
MDHKNIPMSANSSLVFPKWNIYGDPYPPLGLEVIAYNKKWIDEDYNPHGTRIGFQNLSCDTDGEFISAAYCNDCDEYHTTSSDIESAYRCSDAPTHWVHKPMFREENNG